MTASLRPVWIGMLLTGLVLAGCQPTAPLTRVGIDPLVAEYNANARQVPRLWARAKMQLSFNGFSLGSTSPLAASNGLLLLSKTDEPLGPQNFVLIGQETLAMKLFAAGSSVDEGIYYLWHRARDGQAWWGWHELAGAPGTETDAIPIDPNQLLSVLGICELPSNFTQLPTVALTMTHRPGEKLDFGEKCAYVLTYLARQPLTNRILFRREIYFTWDETDPRRPYEIRLLDATGQRIMTAQLRNYKSIETDNADPPPVMPTDIRIAWPGRDAGLHILLSEMTTENRWDIEAVYFRDAETGALPDGVDPANVVPIDAGLEQKGFTP